MCGLYNESLLDNCFPAQVRDNIHTYMFFKEKISATHNASAWGLDRRDPKRFLISTMFRGSLGHLKFDHFYIVDFHSALAFLDRDLRSED